LKDELDALGLSVNEFARRLGVDTPRINEIVHCRRGVTPDTAFRLAQYFGGDPIVWLNLQTKHDLSKYEREYGETTKLEVRVPASA
jgi:addiction module HigA family antidote